MIWKKCPNQPEFICIVKNAIPPEPKQQAYAAFTHHNLEEMETCYVIFGAVHYSNSGVSMATNQR